MIKNRMGNLGRIWKTSTSESERLSSRNGEGRKRKRNEGLCGILKCWKKTKRESDYEMAGHSRASDPRGDDKTTKLCSVVINSSDDELKITLNSEERRCESSGQGTGKQPQEAARVEPPRKTRYSLSEEASRQKFSSWEEEAEYYGFNVNQSVSYYHCRMQSGKTNKHEKNTNNNCHAMEKSNLSSGDATNLLENKENIHWSTDGENSIDGKIKKNEDQNGREQNKKKRRGRRSGGKRNRRH